MVVPARAERRPIATASSGRTRRTPGPAYRPARRSRFAFGIALAAEDFRVAAGRGDDLDRLAIGDGAERLRRSWPRARSSAASARRSAFMRSKVCCRNLRRRDRCGGCARRRSRCRASWPCRPDQRSRASRIICGALFRERRVELAQAIDLAQRRVEAGRDTVLGHRQLAQRALAEQPRIGDPVGEERVDLVELAARNLHASCWRCRSAAAGPR